MVVVVEVVMTLRCWCQPLVNVTMIVMTTIMRCWCQNFFFVTMKIRCQKLFFFCDYKD